MKKDIKMETMNVTKTLTNDEKLCTAIAYLRGRDKYIVDHRTIVRNGKYIWSPTSSASTDVKVTIDSYKKEMKLKNESAQ